MERLLDLAPGRWIHEGLAPTEHHRGGPADWRVEQLIPTGYETYLKILNPVWEHPEHATGGVWVGADDEWDDRFGHPPRGGRRVLWAEAARLAGVPLLPAFTLGWWGGDVPKGRWPPSWAGPGEDALEEPSFTALLRLLKAKTESQTLFAFYELIAALSVAGIEVDPADLLLRGDPDALAAFVNSAARQLTPTFWWPESRAWLVSTPYDLSFTLLGGTRALLEHVALAPDIEALWCEAGTVVWQRSG